jgi:uncharacterized membrane protein
VSTEEQPVLALELRPNASLGPRGLRWLLGAVIAINVVVAVGFSLVGAWPVVAFCGLDVALIWWALTASMRVQRIETITITAQELVWQEIREGRAVQELRFPRSFVFVRMTEDRYGARHSLVLASAGQTYPIALGLGVDERRELAALIDRTLRVRTSPTSATA